ncbi:MAG: pyridoxamine kinase [Oscillospiraceae bacterium]|nr:pyridoxamine kinase [Oscillospiraceae bacterium]
MKLPVKKCAVINDFSGFGRCSIAVALPVLSAMRVQCCALPTAILSNHTGYPNYHFDSYTDKMAAYAAQWKKLSLQFDTIFSGFLGCSEQIDIVLKFFDDFKTDNNIIIVDPVMGDNGKIYSTYSKELCEKMKHLAERADIITPNITEACILAGEKYIGEDISEDFAKRLAYKLSGNGARSVVITGITRGDKIITFVFDRESGNYHSVETRRIKESYPGTGDLFASVLCGAVTNGIPLLEATEFASKFVEETTEYTSRFDTDHNDGIAFEPFLNKLCKFNKD